MSELQDNWLTNKTDLDDAIENGAVVVLFTAPSWCVPCQRFEPHFERATQTAADEKLPVKFFRVDIDTNSWAMVDYTVQSVPTAYLIVDGEKRRLNVPQGGLPFLNDIRAELGV